MKIATTRNRGVIGPRAVWGAMAIAGLLAAPPAHAQLTGQNCSTPDLAIPDNIPAGVTDTLIVPTNGTILDLDVELLITHTWPGDLIVTLEHLDSGTTATLLFRPGDSDGSGPGFSADNIGNPVTGDRFVLDDEAADFYDTPPPDGWGNPGVAGPGIEDVTGAWIPFDSQASGLTGTLSAFDGEDLSGTWALNVSDNDAVLTGTFVEWCLNWTVLDPAPWSHGCGGLNTSFETGNFAGWSTQDLTTPFSALTVGPGFWPPTDGTFAVMHGFDGNGPGVIRVSQDMALPPGTSTLEFDYRAGWDLTVGATLDRTFSVLIEPAGGGAPLQSDLILTAPAGDLTLDTGDLVGTVDVSAFAGSTAHVAFEWDVPENFTGMASFQLDNIRCSGEDCNGNGTDDRDDIGTGANRDCNDNAIPDECEPDADGDGTTDDCDGCPDDAAKVDPGICGCGASDDDTDGDSIPDCFDGCPNDPNKRDPGLCGCNTPDSPDDADDDGVIDCIDNCPNTANRDQADADSNGVGDACEPPPAGQSGACGCGAGSALLVPLMLTTMGWMRRRKPVR